MKETTLGSIHIGLGAKMVEFGGFNMPLVYTSITEEHECVRKKVGLFDVSHMGEFIVKGKEAQAFVQKISSNDASILKPGDAQYSCLPNSEGGVVDDFLVYRLHDDQCNEGEQAFMLVVNASNIEKDWNWLMKANTFDTRLIDISNQSSLLALQGPKAKETLQKITDVNLDNIAYYHFEKGSIEELDDVIISNTGYTGSGGFELYIKNENVAALWAKLIEAGSEFGIMPTGLGARDTLRMEMGFCLYGHELNDSISPLNAGLSWIVKTNKTDDFFSKEFFINQKEEGIKQRLVGFEMEDRRVPRQGYLILNEEGEEIGVVTSGTMSPSLDKPIGLGFVKSSFRKSGTSIQIQIRNKRFKGLVKKLPLYKV